MKILHLGVSTLDLSSNLNKEGSEIGLIGKEEKTEAGSSQVGNWDDVPGEGLFNLDSDVCIYSVISDEAACIRCSLSVFIGLVSQATWY